MTDELFAFLKQCPSLQGVLLNIDYLGKEAPSASLSGGCEDVLIKSYTDGDSLRTCTHVLRVRLPFGADLATNSQNSRTIRQMTDWVKAMSDAGDLPYFSDRRIAVSMSATAGKSPQTVTADSCIYAVSIRTVYYSAR